MCERESVCVCKKVNVCDRKRRYVRGSVCEREREREVRESVRESVCERKCAREREGV